MPPIGRPVARLDKAEMQAEGSEGKLDAPVHGIDFGQVTFERTFGP